MLPVLGNASPSNLLINKELGNPLKPIYLPPMLPLAHNGSMNIRTWLRSEMTGGVYSCVECAVAPKTMGPPPHYHKELDELMYVIEGTASVIVDGREVQIGLLDMNFWLCKLFFKQVRFIA